MPLNKRIWIVNFLKISCISQVRSELIFCCRCLPRLIGNITWARQFSDILSPRTNASLLNPVWLVLLLMPSPISLCPSIHFIVSAWSSITEQGQAELNFQILSAFYSFRVKSPMGLCVFKSSGQFLVLKTRFSLDIQDPKLPWFSLYSLALKILYWFLLINWPSKFGSILGLTCWAYVFYLHSLPGWS